MTAAALDLAAADRPRAQQIRQSDGSAWASPPHPLSAVNRGCHKNASGIPGTSASLAREPRGQGTGAGSRSGGVWA